MYYRKIKKTNINKIKEDFQKDQNSIRLQPVIDEFDCSGNCLSVYENIDCDNDACETAIVFTTLTFENHYIVLDDKDFEMFNLNKPIKGPCSIGYTKGEESHKNIPNLKLTDLDSLVRLFVSKDIKKIGKQRGRKLLLLAYKNNMVTLDNLKKPVFLVKVSEAINNDNEVYDFKNRADVLENVQKQLREMISELVGRFIEQKSSTLIEK